MDLHLVYGKSGQGGGASGQGKWQRVRHNLSRGQSVSNNLWLGKEISASREGGHTMSGLRTFSSRTQVDPVERGAYQVDLFT